MRRSSRLFLTANVLCLLAVSCGGESRPSLDAWVPQWDSAVQTVASATVTPGTPTEPVCQETLGILREASVGLKPTPDVVLDETVTMWLEVAEGAFFDCNAPSAGRDTFADAIAELDRLEAEVAVVVQIDDAGA